MFKTCLSIMFAVILSAASAHAMSVLDTGVQPEGCCAKFDFSPTLGTFVLSIPCTKVGDKFYALELSWNGSGLDLFNYWETQGSCASGCDGSGGGSATCIDCSCPDYALAHASECGQTGALNFRLTWGGGNDVDLHVVYNGGQEEIWYNNKSGSTTGGSLDVDANAGCTSNVTNSPVENIFYDNPPAGSYTMKVCGYENCGNGDTAVTAQVLVDGRVVWENTVTVTTWDNSCIDVYTYNVN